MDDSRFDAWTRRGFGIAAAGAAGGLAVTLGNLSPFGGGDASAEKQRCRKLQQACKPHDKKKRCCKGQGLLCEIVVGLNGRHCCRSVGAACTEKADCCGFLECVDGECSEDVN